MKKRTLVICLHDQLLEIGFGTYGLMLYYANQLSPTASKLLLDCTTSEYWYRLDYNLPLEGLEDGDDNAHFDIGEISQLIDWIDHQIIPALEQEDKDLIEKYGGEANFYQAFQQSGGTLENIGLNTDHEWFNSHPKDLMMYFRKCSKMLQYALLQKTPFEVFVD